VSAALAPDQACPNPGGAVAGQQCPDRVGGNVRYVYIRNGKATTTCSTSPLWLNFNGALPLAGTAMPEQALAAGRPQSSPAARCAGPSGPGVCRQPEANHGGPQQAAASTAPVPVQPARPSTLLAPAQS
jgi:hypothetical protein